MKPSDTWLPLSNVTVNLKPSKIYQKILLLVYIFLIAVLFCAHFPYGLDVGLLLFFSVYFFRLFHLRTLDSFETYQIENVKFDFGFALLLIFKNETTTRQLIFQDQVNSEIYRIIRVLAHGK